MAKKPKKTPQKNMDTQFEYDSRYHFKIVARKNRLRSQSDIYNIDM